MAILLLWFGLNQLATGSSQYEYSLLTFTASYTLNIARWFKDLPTVTANTLLALAGQFERGGTEELENPYVFNAPDVVKAGGHQALKILGQPKDVISEMKTRLFAV
jgi:hypothetical protein